MHVIRSDSDVIQIHEPELRCLIDQRIKETAEYVDHFSELVFYIVVQAGDSPEEVDAQVGFPLLRNRFDGETFGSSGFTPSWDLLEEHRRYFELVYVLSDDGAGVGVFIAKGEDTQPELLKMCRQFATEKAAP